MKSPVNNEAFEYIRSNLENVKQCFIDSMKKRKKI